MAADMGYTFRRQVNLEEPSDLFRRWSRGPASHAASQRRATIASLLAYIPPRRPHARRPGPARVTSAWTGPFDVSVSSLVFLV